MSSSPATTPTTASAAGERQTYWCHECDMSVSLLSPTTATATAAAIVTATANPLCPYCHGDFLEEMDSPLFNPNPNLSPFPTESTTFQIPSIAISDDNFLLDSPYLHRLIQHLATTSNDGSSPSTSRHHSPASKTAIEAISTVAITHTLLSPDPILLCAVCKDQFVIDDETKQLPCKHMYHPGCILPWLEQHNSCPVCRFQLPVEGGGDSKGRRRRSRILRMSELMESGEELSGFGSTLRNIARRHRIVFPRGNVRRLRDREGSHNGDEESLFSATQIREVDSVETESSWWPVEVGGGDGAVDGEIGVSVSGSQGNDDGDITLS